MEVAAVGRVEAEGEENEVEEEGEVERNFVCS
jgi:hypothetical protein